MGARKRRTSNMVTPSWENFQRPNQVNPNPVQRLNENKIPVENHTEQNSEQEYQQEAPGQVQDEMKSKNSIQWGDFQTTETFQGNPDPTADEGLLDYTMRNASANASRLAEQFLGKIGNTEKFVKDILTNYPQVGGLLPWGISKLIGPERWERAVRGEPGKEQMFPTSEKLKEISHKVTNDYTKPRTPGEEKFQGFTEDVGSMIGGRTPITHRNPLVQTAINKVLVPAAANVTKKVVQDLGFGEDNANMAKMAIWIPLILAANVNAPRYASNLMNAGRNGLPNNLTANTQRFTQRLDAVEATLLNSDPRTALARQTSARIRQDIANGQLNSRSMMNMYDGVNAAKRDAGLFSMNATDQRFARRAINQVLGSVRDEIVDMGVNHPAPIANWQNGLQAWAAIHQSRAVSNYVEGLAKGPYAKLLGGPAAALFGVGSYGATKALPGFAKLGVAAAVPAMYKTGQVLHRIYNSPVLANYYWHAISAATMENSQAFISNYNKLNKELEKSPAESGNKSKKK